MKLIYKIFAVIAIAQLLASCKKENYAETNKGNTPLVIAASKETLVLNEKEKNGEALALAWTTGTNQGTNASIGYTLQLAKQGTNFSDPVSEDMGTAVYSYKFTTGKLNEIALSKYSAVPGTTVAFEARVIAQAKAAGLEPEVSSPVVINVVPYEPVSTTLYLIGDATPNGWDNANATPLTAVEEEPGVFTWTGLLIPGEFKFMTTLGEWLPTYNKGTEPGTLFYRTDFGEPDDKFTVASMATYTVKADLISKTVTIAVPTNPTVPPYERLWIVGDATPNGWNIDAPSEMRVDAGNLFVFDFNEVLKAGEFKIPTTTGNWGGDFYMPLVNQQDLSADGVQLVKGGSPDNKWKITTPGAYKIKLDLYSTKISITPFTPYTKLWLVGDATPAGWNIDNPTPMTADAGNPYLFTWEGAMTAGEFKIPVGTGNWGGDYFMPMVNHQDLSLKQAKFVKGGNPDNKWQITAPGTYRITINQLKETVDIEKL